MRRSRASSGVFGGGRKGWRSGGGSYCMGRRHRHDVIPSVGFHFLPRSDISLSISPPFLCTLGRPLGTNQRPAGKIEVHVRDARSTNMLQHLLPDSARPSFHNEPRTYLIQLPSFQIFAKPLPTQLASLSRACLDSTLPGTPRNRL